MSRIADLRALSAAIDEELAEMNKVAGRVALTGTTAECARFDAHGDRLVAERAKVRVEIKSYELSVSSGRVFPNDIANAEASSKIEYAKQRQLEDVLRSLGGACK